MVVMNIGMHMFANVYFASCNGISYAYLYLQKSPRNNKCTSENGNVEGLQFHDLRPGMCIYNEPDETGSVKIKLLPSDGDSLEKSKDISSTKINHGEQYC